VRGELLIAGSAAESSGRSLSRRFAQIALTVASVAMLGALTCPTASAACPNETFRVGPSAQLPDCRAYEMVTPREVNGVPQAGMGPGAEDMRFSSPPALATGDTYLWKINPGGLPGTGSSGYSNLYASKRTPGGWVVSRLNPLPTESEGSDPGGFSQDQKYVLFQVEGFRGGSLAYCLSCLISYLRYPDGTFHLFGEGTVPADPDTDEFENGFVDDPFPQARWITPDGTHQIFESRVQLTSEAPGEGSSQVYDRTAEGLHLVSLPDGDPPLAESSFAGASADGSTVLFLNAGSLYARIDNARTLEVADGEAGEVKPGGVSENGSIAFFVQNGNITAYDVAEEAAIPFVTTGDGTLVHVSPDGSHAYFVSETELAAGDGVAGAPNLYVWNGSSIQFIATLSPEDLVRSENPFRGLALWTPGIEARTPATNADMVINTARTTPDGKVFVFESRAQLTAYPNEGHIEIYRYDVDTEVLVCASCSPTQPAASADSELVVAEGDGVSRVHQMVEIPNLSSDGKQIVFESRDALLPGDVNGVRDVYEWRSGVLSLISSGHSAQPSGLFGVTPSGRDIFLLTGEKLVGRGQETGSFAVYDARVEGGLAPQQAQAAAACTGEACQGQPASIAGFSPPASSVFHGKGNVKHRCQRHRRHGHRNRASRKRAQKGKSRHGRCVNRGRAGK
jgi:hypothetical protein